eukprot:IDg17848t1
MEKSRDEMSSPLRSCTSNAAAERERRLADAVAMVESDHATGRVSVRMAARVHGIPRSTLQRYLKVSRTAKQSNRSQRSSSSTKQISKCDIRFLVHRN